MFYLCQERHKASINDKGCGDGRVDRASDSRSEGPGFEPSPGGHFSFTRGSRVLESKPCLLSIGSKAMPAMVGGWMRNRNIEPTLSVSLSLNFQGR